MILSELILEVRNEIDDVREVDIIFAINSFLQENRVSKEIVFHITGIRDHVSSISHLEFGIDERATVTPVSSDFDYSVSRYDYEVPFVTFDVVLYGDNDRFMIPADVVRIRELWFKDRELTRYNVSFPSSKTADGVIIKSSRELEFNFSLEVGDSISCFGWIIYPNIALNPPQSLEIPFPVNYYPALKAFVFAKLYGSKRYLDGEMYQFKIQEYERLKRQILLPIGDYREGDVSI